MPGLPFQRLPQAGSPYDIVDSQIKDTQQYFQRQGRILERTPLSDAQFRRSFASLKAQYDERMFRIRQARGQLDTVQSMIGEGKISPQAGQRTMWNLVLPPETARAMFPPEGKAAGAPFSLSALKAYKETIIKMAQKATSEFLPWYKRAYLLSSRGQEQAEMPQANLITVYKNWQDTIGYDGMNITQKRQLDIQWDRTMQQEGYKNWNPKTVQHLRIKGRINRAITTPFGRSIRQAKGPTIIEQPIAKRPDPLGIR